MSSLSVSTITGPSGLSLPNVTSINGGQLAGMRNKIINGKMEIAQRGASFAAIANSAHSLDRYMWQQASGAVLTASQQADAPSNEFQSSLRFAVTTADTAIAAGEYAFVSQRVEGYNARDLIGRAVTLSFWVRSSKTGTHCINLRCNGFDRSFIAEYTVNAANTWEYKAITVTGGLITAGSWNWTNGLGLEVGWALAAGSTFQTTANAWQTGNFLATTNQVNVLDTVGNIFAITGVQLEVGNVATPFEHRPYGTELALCQRYFYRVNSPVYGVSGDSTSLGGTIKHPQTMRVSPTVSHTFSDANYVGTSPTGSQWNIQKGGVLYVTKNLAIITSVAPNAEAVGFYHHFNGNSAWLQAGGNLVTAGPSAFYEGSSEL